MKVNLTMHLVAQLLAQAAVAALVPAGYEKYYAAAIAVVGVFVAFFDNANPQTPA